jgi:hypothetical protein
VWAIIRFEIKKGFWEKVLTPRRIIGRLGPTRRLTHFSISTNRHHFLVRRVEFEKGFYNGLQYETMKFTT